MILWWAVLIAIFHAVKLKTNWTKILTGDFFKITWTQEKHLHGHGQILLSLCSQRMLTNKLEIKERTNRNQEFRQWTFRKLRWSLRNFVDISPIKFIFSICCYIYRAGKWRWLHLTIGLNPLLSIYFNSVSWPSHFKHLSKYLSVKMINILSVFRIHRGLPAGLWRKRAAGHLWFGWGDRLPNHTGQQLQVRPQGAVSPPPPPSQTAAKAGRKYSASAKTPLLPSALGKRYSQTMLNIWLLATLGRCELPYKWNAELFQSAFFLIITLTVIHLQRFLDQRNK